MKGDDISEVSSSAVLNELARSLSGASAHAEATELLVAAMRRLRADCGVLILSVRGLAPGQFRIARWTPRGGAEVVSQPPDFEPARLAQLPTYSGGLVSNLITVPHPHVAQRVAAHADAALGDHLRMAGVVAAAPLFETGRIDGWVMLFLDQADSGVLADLAAAAAILGLTYSRLALVDRLRRIDGELQKEIDQISRLQRAMLPTMLPAVPGLDLAAGYKTFDRAGGDYYDVFPLGGGSERRAASADDQWGILVADASGHGPSATVVVSMLSGVLHAYAGRPSSPAEFLDYLNRHLFARDFCGDFVTAVFAIYDPATRRLTWAHAGHNPPLLKDAQTGAVRVLDEPGGIPLGIMDRVDAGDHVLQLEPGQLVLLYTDGVVDERNDDDKPFGLERLTQLVADNRAGPAGLVETLSRALDAHQGVTRPEDDQTMLALRLLA